MSSSTPEEMSAVKAAQRSGPTLDLSSLTVLSAQGAALELAPEQRDMMCLTSDGTLHISEAHRNSNYVLAYRELLTRRKFSFRPRFVPHTEVAKLYKKFAANKGPIKVDQSIRQSEVISLIRQADEMGASDIHFHVKKNVTEIAFRVDGDLLPRPELGAQHGMDLVSTIYQSMCDIAQPMFMPNKSQDARLNSSSITALGLKGARLATRPTDSGVLAVLRLLKNRKRKLTLEELGFVEPQVKIVNSIVERTTKGLFIICGATGSGKSTTLETVLSDLMVACDFKKRLITIEDPPEYEIVGAVQTPVQYASDATDEEISAAWARAITNLMRLDLDLAMVGEIRDYASSIAAFRAAMTGHGVFTTLHANDPVSALLRLKDMGVDLSLLTDPSIVTGLAAQTLAPRLCEACKRPFKGFSSLVAAGARARVEKFCDVDSVFVKGADLNCSECKGRGIRGRIVIAETLEPTEKFMKAFVNGGHIAARKFWIEEMHGLTRNKVLIQRINEGLIDPVMGESAVCLLNEDEFTLG